MIPLRIVIDTFCLFAQYVEFDNRLNVVRPNPGQSVFARFRTISFLSEFGKSLFSLAMIWIARPVKAKRSVAMDHSPCFSAVSTCPS